MGVIGSKPELRYSMNGKPFVRINLATHRRIKDERGELRRETQWHRVMLWGKLAETCANYCPKGTPLYIEGHMAPVEKELEDGTTEYQITVVGDQIQLIPGVRLGNTVS
jgi:single-strand DNA-binding protein